MFQSINLVKYVLIYLWCQGRPELPGQPRGVYEADDEDDGADVLPRPPGEVVLAHGEADADEPLDGDGDDHVDGPVVGDVAEVVQHGHKLCMQRKGYPKFAINTRILNDFETIT